MNYDSCKGIHVTMMGIPPPEDRMDPPENDDERRALERGGEFMDAASGFLLEQGQRPATIGLVLSSSPLALLTWFVAVFPHQRNQEANVAQDGREDIGVDR
jgi:microsomal epoxide hydrolase